MKKNLLLVLIVSFTINYSVFAQRDTIYTFGEDKGDIEYFFGFNLIETAMGGMIHLALVKPMSDGTFQLRQLTKDGFIAQALGKEKSLANPDGIDLFKKYEIDDPNILDQLWKLRYKEYPYFTSQQVEPGWSANDSIPFLPTESQMNILQKFGLYKMSDYIYGENAFRLLNLMTKPEWVLSYKESY